MKTRDVAREAVLVLIQQGEDDPYVLADAVMVATLGEVERRILELQDGLSGNEEYVLRLALAECAPAAPPEDTRGFYERRLREPSPSDVLARPELQQARDKHLAAIAVTIHKRSELETIAPTLDALLTLTVTLAQENVDG